MTPSFSGSRAFMTGTLAVALLGVTPVPASATTDAEMTRLQGPDRYSTAAAVSRDTWGSQEAQAVVLARGDVFADALAGTPLAAAKNGPLLLTTPSSLGPSASNEIKRVLPSGRNVYLLGGTMAISDAVARSISDLGYKPVRLGGADRYATATTISRQITSPSTIFEATGLSFPSALVAGVTAAKVGGVVVLTADSKMPAATKTYLDQRAGVSRVAVGPEATAADPSARSIRGADKYDTSRRLAEAFFDNPSVVSIASGTVFADALSGGAHAGKNGAPLVLSEPATVPTPVRQYLSSVSPSVSDAYLYGGPAALSVDVEDISRNLIRGAVFFADGTYKIGEDIPAGTYRTRREPEFCYWERLSGFSGEFKDIEANGASTYNQVVTILPDDAGFKTKDCGIWTSDLTAITTSPTASFGDGMWIVGTDIAATTWSAPGGDECYWARLADFTGGIDSIIANDVGTKNPVVTIESSDAGFETARCGQWRPVS
jgi:putative cell wall-binding protein